MNYDVNRQLDPATGTWANTITMPREEAVPLLAKVLAITAAGFLVTAAGVVTAPVGGTTIAMIAVFGLVFAIQAVRKKNPAIGLSLFFILAYCMGWFIGPVIHAYIRTIGIGVVYNAAATTGLGMGAMACVAYLFQINYRKLLGYATAALLVLVLAGIASIFFHFMTPDTYSWLTPGVFTALTIGDFARIRAGGDGQPAVSLALSIYLDGINIFLATLQLLGGRRRN